MKRWSLQLFIYLGYAITAGLGAYIVNMWIFLVLKGICVSVILNFGAETFFRYNMSQLCLKNCLIYFFGVNIREETFSNTGESIFLLD